MSPAPFNNHSRTLRLVVPCNLAAGALQVLFSNCCGKEELPIGAASLALCNRAGAQQPGTLVPVTVGGVLSFKLAPGQELLSDTIRFPLAAGDFLALNIYYSTRTRVASGNWVGRQALRSRMGNFSADAILPGPSFINRVAQAVVTTDMTVATTTVRRITALCPAPGRVVGCFGDSITQQSTWTEPLSKRLYRRWPGQVTLCNLGIGGNRLLYPSPASVNGMYGDAGVARFARDMLDLPGLTHAILELGTNDIGLPGSHGAPPGEVPTLARYAASMQELAGRLHEKKVRVYAATLAPRPIAKPYDEAREALRCAMNDFLRAADCFDAVLDFDAVLRRPDGAPGIREGLVIPDGLHPSPYGGLLLAKSVDLGLFGGEHDG